MAPKKQINISVRQTDKKKPTWIVWITEVDFELGQLTAVLPGEFKRGVANIAANTLARSYRECGYNVALRTAKRSRG